MLHKIYCEEYQAVIGLRQFKEKTGGNQTFLCLVQGKLPDASATV
jgi:hypothetical protein